MELINKWKTRPNPTRPKSIQTRVCTQPMAVSVHLLKSMSSDCVALLMLSPLWTRGRLKMRDRKMRDQKAFSGPAFSSPCILVMNYPVLHFRSNVFHPHFGLAFWSCIFQSCIFWSRIFGAHGLHGPADFSSVAVYGLFIRKMCVWCNRVSISTRISVFYTGLALHRACCI